MVDIVSANHVPLGPEPRAADAQDPREWTPPATAESFSIRDLAAAAGLNGNGWTYDTAVPQDWANEVERLTTVYPFGHGIVWAYGPSDSGYFLGRPYALTPEGAMLLKWAAHESDAHYECGRTSEVARG